MDSTNQAAEKGVENVQGLRQRSGVSAILPQGFNIKVLGERRVSTLPQFLKMPFFILSEQKVGLVLHSPLRRKIISHLRDEIRFVTKLDGQTREGKI